MQDGAATEKRMKPSSGATRAGLSLVSRNFSRADQEERHCMERDGNLHPWWVCGRAASCLDKCIMWTEWRL